MKMPRGGPTTLAGFLFLLTGAVGALVGVTAITQAFVYQLANLWVPIPPTALLELYGVAGLACTASGVGGYLVIVARPDRAREEDSYLDPLAYLPRRGPRRRALAAALVAAALTAVPVVAFVPSTHSIAFTVPVTVCGASDTAPITLVLPRDALLTYAWRSASGQPISLVRTPTGPSADNLSSRPGTFVNSTAGFSALQSNGPALRFSACNTLAQWAVANTTWVEVTGTYYALWL